RLSVHDALPISAARLRIEIDSMPEDLDQLERQIRPLEIEREAVKRDNGEEKLTRINEQIASLEDDRKELRARWQQEKDLIQTVQKAKENIEALRVEADNFERAGEYGKVAEIRYGQIPQLEQEVRQANERLAKIQTEG